MATSLGTLDIFFRPLADALGLRHAAVDSALLLTLALARWLPVVAIAPFLGGRSVPAAIKMGLGLLLAVWMLPWLSSQAPVPLAMSSLAWWALLAREIVVGLILGLGAGLIFWAAEMGGLFIDSVRGGTISNVLIPQIQIQSSMLGNFYYQLYVVLFVLAGGHRWFLSAVFDSYTAVPPFVPGLSLAATARGFIDATGATFTIALKLIAPALVVVMLLDLVLGVANRMAPQLNVFFLGLPLKSMLAFLAIGLSLYYVLSVALADFGEHREWLRQTVDGLAPDG